jgi:hypothetical protein
MYVAAGEETITSALVVERDGGQLLVYIISHALREAEIQYPTLEKSFLAIVHTTRRLR